MPLWRGTAPLILASRSAVRHALLTAAGIPHVVEPADIDERTIELQAAMGNSGEVAELLAREKALAISGRRPGSYVLGADQTLALGERRFSKPANAVLARKQLACLRGRTHELHSALAVVRDGKLIFQHRERARLAMRDFSCSSASRGTISSFLDCRSCRCWSVCAEKDCWSRDRTPFVQCSSSALLVLLEWESLRRHVSSPKRAFLCMPPTRWCIGFMQGKRRPRSKRRFLAPLQTARSTGPSSRLGGWMIPLRCTSCARSSP